LLANYGISGDKYCVPGILIHGVILNLFQDPSSRRIDCIRDGQAPEIQASPADYDPALCLNIVPFVSHEDTKKKKERRGLGAAASYFLCVKRCAQRCGGSG
jgi:hypothetical protein